MIVRVKNNQYYEKIINKNSNISTMKGTFIMATMTNVKTDVKTETKTRYVIGPGGVRMTYDEWIEMRRNEMN